MSLRGIVSSSIFFLVFAVSVFVLSNCGGANATSTPQASGTNQSQDSVTTTTQTGDIPDTQAFVTYRSPQGRYELVVPEGWARTATATDVTFVDKFNSVGVQLSQVKTAPTENTVRANEAVTLQQTGNAVQDVKVQTTQLQNGTAILLTYTENSSANEVTGTQIRLEKNRYLFFHNGTLATLTLSAVMGADNVDQWARMSRSFRWL